MGFSFSRDGLCKDCGFFTQENCDACGRWICHEHMHFEKVDNSNIIHHVLCADCRSTTAPKWFMHRTRLMVKFNRLAHNHYMTVPDT
jgi:hypothetical protein